MPSNLDQAFLQIALDLGVDLPSGHRYQRLISSLNDVLPCDASALFILTDDKQLRPVAVVGLSEEVLGKRFDPGNHPRLQAILDAREPVRFAADSTLPDPFDGILKNDPSLALNVHDCMGCSLYAEQQLIGILTLDALQPGAFDDIDDVTIKTFTALAAATIRNASMVDALKSRHRRQQSINKLLIEEARNRGGELIGTTPTIEQLRNNIQLVANSNFAVLISGETGTGKELVAHAVHAQSPRANQPMIYVNCAALPESIAESELFGHVKGAFTGASTQRTGKFELAHSGTIFLDEVGELPLLLQAKLLRVIQQGEVQRVGADRNLQVDVRVIAATNRQLEVEVREGRFRSDLYHRLNVFPINVPPLREHKGDLAILSGHILDRVRRQFNARSLHLHPQASRHLEQHSWPGNVRELEHSLMRAALRAIQSNEQLITLEHFNDGAAITQQPEPISTSGNDNPVALRQAVEDFQRQLIDEALERNNGVWARAAKELQVDRGNLYKIGKRLGL
ncbi:anaerobic nitric oxide reductase transcription regulator [Sinobacterium caligoides]|uniref:Anaerobic nitric oxide reductase transcription regulator n=1 Tax=Sinobacterium caligoides TaxID=933926 RepID=A0A3N2E002_9GAMM|nr:nitric oxide reductase transcriptional regulator NorR [Sinobacterium caligoides]ROS05408.1 anaerobic nitric oxide reductase transcription regulator [Sinobacterium caligoides]